MNLSPANIPAVAHALKVFIKISASSVPVAVRPGLKDKQITAQALLTKIALRLSSPVSSAEIGALAAALYYGLDSPLFSQAEKQVYFSLLLHPEIQQVLDSAL